MLSHTAKLNNSNVTSSRPAKIGDVIRGCSTSRVWDHRTTKRWLDYTQSVPLNEVMLSEFHYIYVTFSNQDYQ